MPTSPLVYENPNFLIIINYENLSYLSILSGIFRHSMHEYSASEIAQLSPTQFYTEMHIAIWYAT